MSNIALIICAGNNPQLTDTGYFRPVWKNFSRILAHKSYFDDFARKAEVYDDLDCYTLMLPHSLEELKAFTPKKLRKINKQIKDFCSDYGILQCYLPECLKNLYPFPGSQSVIHHGKLLYRSLLNMILSQIQHKKGLETKDLEIAVVQGESLDELNSVLLLISPYVRYATVVVNDRSAVEPMLESIYNETGLSIGITEDNAGGMRDACFIINLGGLKSCPPYPNIAASAVLLNYADEKITGFFLDNIVINGIQVNLPSSLLFQFDKGIYDYFSKLEIAEILLSHKLEIQNEEEGRIINDDRVLSKLSEEFRRDGFKISGFVGTHETFKLKDA